MLQATANELLPFTPKPILKWVGGKSRVVPQLLPLLPAQVGTLRHVEPFVGSAALFFALRPRRALLGDINRSLCAMYEAVRDQVEDVIVELSKLAREHNAFQYYVVRRQYNDARNAAKPSVLRAAQFVYLNRTCFNGLHRLNSRGEFNVPVGDRIEPWTLGDDDVELLRAVSRELGRAELYAEEFSQLRDRLGPGDFVYCDPPYDTKRGARSFVRYNGKEFGPPEQDALCATFAELDRRGCLLMQSNSDTPANRWRYRHFNITTVRVARSVNCNAHARGCVSELVIRNYA